MSEAPISRSLLRIEVPKIQFRFKDRIKLKLINLTSHFEANNHLEQDKTHNTKVSNKLFLRKNLFD